ncbi:hypothetical protein HAX54_006727 [Datura stramonium]|uniref:Uncharacterized protein n=1 Tax=Datura stramonium TaxID=4076 RepID=A0ABS8TBW4_DATST|nr:hypothetical protein [Datura stramonium]
MVHGDDSRQFLAKNLQQHFVGMMLLLGAEFESFPAARVIIKMISNRLDVLNVREEVCINRFRHANTLQSKTFADTTKLSQWLELSKNIERELNKMSPTSAVGIADNHLLSCCLVGTFNDPFNYSPNQEVILTSQLPKIRYFWSVQNLVTDQTK